MCCVVLLNLNEHNKHQFALFIDHCNVTTFEEMLIVLIEQAGEACKVILAKFILAKQNCFVQ